MDDREHAVPRREGRRLSLAGRITLGVATVMLPLVVLAGAAVASLRVSTTHFSHGAETATRGAIPLAQLEVALVESERGAYEAVLSEDWAAAEERWSLRAAEVDAGFSRIADHPIGESPLVRSAFDRWQRAKAEVGATLDLRSGARIPAGIAQLEAFSDDVRAASANLDAAEEVAVGALGDELADARALERSMLLLVAAACLAGLSAAILAGRRLAQTILVPVRALSDGARRLGEGDLSHRLDLHRHDELGRLGDGFDAMAAELQRSQEELNHRALHDPLTGLANRMLLMERLEHALNMIRRKRSPLALLLLDLDGFKNVNDSLGHQVGDEVLVAVGRRVESCLRPGDTAARLGGDEFGVLLEDVAGATNARAVAERINDALRVPLVVEGEEVFLDGSIGVALSVDGSEDPDELLRNADLAMYRAKHRGKGRNELFEAAMHTAAVERLGLEAELRRALERGEIIVHYQPVVDLISEKVVGVEALARWEHPERGLVQPDDFIPTAEDTGLVVPLGWHVLQTTCHQAMAWARESPLPPDFRVSVNLSARQLLHPRLLDEVGSALRSSGLPPARLVLEITEVAMVLDGQPTLAVLRRLKELGVRVAVDDFGTGYSALGYLRRFPIDVLKIDRSFVGGLAGTGDATDGALVEAIVRVADALGLEIVAEGVERSSQVAALLRLGCRLGQGFHFSVPVDAERLALLLVSQRTTRPAFELT